MVDHSVMERIRKANHSWVSSIQHEMHDFQYDHDADILYIAYGEPTDAFSVPLDVEGEDVYLRIEHDTYRIVGVDFLHFRKIFIANHAEIQAAFDSFSSILGDLDWRIQLRLPSEDEEGKVSLMVPAHTFLDYFPSYIPKVAPELVPA